MISKYILRTAKKFTHKWNFLLFSRLKILRISPKKFVLPTNELFSDFSLENLAGLTPKNLCYPQMKFFCFLVWKSCEFTPQKFVLPTNEIFFYLLVWKSCGFAPKKFVLPTNELFSTFSAEMVYLKFKNDICVNQKWFLYSVTIRTFVTKVFMDF